MSAEAAIESLHELNPHALRLAESVSFAMMIDRAFLRAVRLSLTPPVDAGAEADLWFSALVQSRTADGIVLHPEAADALRHRLTRERVEEVWALTRREHAWLAPSLQLEERIAYLSVSRKPTAEEDLADCLRSVLAAMVSGEREGLAQWAVRALAMFPSRIQALPEARMLDTGTRMRLGDRIAPTPNDEPFPSWVPWIVPSSLGTVPLDFELREGELEIRTTTAETPLRVPRTNPLLLEVSWEDDARRRQTRQITFRPEETVVVPVSGRELVLRTITGEMYDLRERGQAPARLRDAIIDFSAEMQKHRHVEGREEEIAEILHRSREHQVIAVTGQPGSGKTAFLCELIREARRRRMNVFPHFFRFGDLRLESVASAERSLAAQIALRFDLQFRETERPLPEVLAQLAQPLLIVLDNADQSRNSLREIAPMLESAALPPFLRAIATATIDEPFADHIHVLAPRDHRFVIRKKLRMTLQLEPDVRQSVGALAAAWMPLPLPVAQSMVASIPVRVEGEDAEIVNAAARHEILAEAIRPAEAHKSLVDLLTQARSNERIDAYYLLNAPFHLMAAGDFEAAERLCTSIDFMVAKIRKHGVDALAADYSALARRGAMPIGSAAFTSLLQWAGAIEAAPQDVGAILYTAFYAQNVIDEAATAYGIPELPMLPEPLADVRRLEVMESRKHEGPIRGCSSTGSRIVTWSDDGTARFWFEDRRVTPAAVVLDHGAAITAAHLDWPVFLSGDAHGFLRLWDFQEAQEIVKVAAHDQAIDGIHAAADRALIVTWSGTAPIRLWDWDRESIALRSELTSPAGAIAGCTLIGDGELLVAASRDGTCRLWRISDGALLDTQTLSGPATGTAIHWNEEPRIVLTASRKIDVVMATPSGLNVHPIDTGHELPPRGVVVGSDPTYTATWSEDQTVRLWRFGMSQPRLILRGHRAAVTACRFAFDSGHPWLVSADADGVAIVWDCDSGEIVSQFHGHCRAIRAIGVGDGVEAGTIVTAGDDGIPLEWDARTGALIADYSQALGRAAACVVLPGDEPAAVVSDGESRIIVASRELVEITRPLFTASANAVFACAGDGSSAVSVDLASRFAVNTDLPPEKTEISAYAAYSIGRRALGTNDGQLYLLHASPSWTLLDHHDGRVGALAFGAMPSLVSLSDDRILGVWNLENGRRVHRIEAHSSRVLALAVQESVAVTGSAAGTLRLWDLETGRATATLRHVHVGPVTGLRMARNVLVSASLDRTIRIFDHRLGQELAVCRGHTGTITGVTIALHEEAIFSCGEDRTIRRWDIATGKQQGVVYGTAPFRCIDWRDGTLIAGDDAGILWTVANAPEKSRTIPNVFLIYSRDDSEFADRLREDLAHAARFSELEEASTVIAIVSRALFDSTYARQEVNTALRLRKPIIPLLQAMNRSDLAIHLPELESYASFTDTAWSDEKRYAVFLRQLIDALD